jgi:hypothetical protein
MLEVDRTIADLAEPEGIWPTADLGRMPDK